MLARKAAIMEGSKSPDGLVDSDDDARVNGEIPVVGDTLKVKGIGFPVKVTKITESKNTVDARGGCSLYVVHQRSDSGANIDLAGKLHQLSNVRV
jgi:hypothetical protein